MTIDQLEKNIQDGKLNSIYLLYGEENYLLDNMVKKIKKQFGELVSGINYITIDDTNIASIIPEIETPAFGFEKKLIQVKNTGLFKKDARNAEVANQKEKLAKYITENEEMINNNVVIIFIEESADKFKLYKLLEKVRSSM